MAGSIVRHFAELPDPRSEQGRRHLLTDMMAITLCAVICGADGWVEVEDFGKAKLGWLKLFLRLPRGIPSHDTFGRLFARLDPAAMERCFVKWVGALVKAGMGRLIAIDGKTLRRSFDQAGGKAAIHMVNAWCSANRLVLGQLATDLKSNEIKAIPRLLELLDLKDAVVTIDAMGCQREIAQKIVRGGGDYLLAVKDNHRTLHEELKLFFDEAIAGGWEHTAHAYHQTVEKDHGRIETRRLWCTREVGWFRDRSRWEGMKSIACVECTREIAGKTGVERRYYISSLAGADAAGVLEIIRGHWGVENQLHWSLDVTFGEDDSRVRTGYAAEHLARIRRLALGLLQREKSFKAGLKRKRLRCALEHDYLLKVLTT
jgi:predicted transposase YbfD/YdcC